MHTLKRISFVLSLFGFVAVSTAAAAQSDASWSLRFPAKRSAKVMTVGCYGTASYGYVLPRAADVRAYRATLAAFATDRDLNGFVITSDRDADGDIVTVDLATGELGAIPAVFNANDLGVPFCLCRPALRYARYEDGRPNCSATRALPPLGETFLAIEDAAP